MADFAIPCMPFGLCALKDFLSRLAFQFVECAVKPVFRGYLWDKENVVF